MAHQPSDSDGKLGDTVILVPVIQSRFGTLFYSHVGFTELLQLLTTEGRDSVPVITGGRGWGWVTGLHRELPQESPQTLHLPGPVGHCLSWKHTHG